jgi:hypothetical protein
MNAKHSTNDLHSQLCKRRESSEVKNRGAEKKVISLSQVEGIMVYRLCLFVILISVLFISCGQEIYSTPQKTLQRYVQYREMGSIADTENCLETFTDATRKWWADNRLPACYQKFGQFSNLCGEGKVDVSNQWGAFVDPVGPKTTEVESADINEKAGTAVLTVQGQQIHFLKEKGNWKINGLFGAEEEMRELVRQRGGQ